MQEMPDADFSFKSPFTPLTIKKAIFYIVIIGFILFFNGLFNGFVGDDLGQIVSNKLIQSLGNLPLFFSGSTFFNGGASLTGVYYRPFMTTYYALVYALFGLNPFGFHLIQTFLIIINACLVFLLFKRFFKIPIAFLFSLIFLVHPINSEVGFHLADVQECLFFFFGIIALLKLIQSQGKNSFLSVTFFLFFSLLSKESGILFVGISLIYLFIFSRKYLLKHSTYLGGMFIIYIILRFHAIGIFPQNNSDTPMQALSLLSRLPDIPAILAFYIKTFFFLIILSSSYQWFYTRVSFSNFILPLLVDTMFFVCVFLLGNFLHKKNKSKEFELFLFFFLWFFIGLLLHIQIIPLDATVAEGWFYFPIVGLLGLLGILFESYVINKSNRTIGYSVVVIIVVFLSLRTFDRSFDWRNQYTFASHDIQVSQSYSLDSVLSSYYVGQGQYQKAKLYAQKSVTTYPSLLGYENLGVAEVGLKDYKEAKESYLKALHYGNYYQVYDNLGTLALQYGDQQENIQFLEKAIQQFPQDGHLWTCLAVLEYGQKNVDDAQYAITQAVKYNNDPNIVSIYEIIMNQKPLHINFTQR